MLAVVDVIHTANLGYGRLVGLSFVHACCGQLLVVNDQLVAANGFPAASVMPPLTSTVYFLLPARVVFGLSVTVLVDAE